MTTLIYRRVSSDKQSTESQDPDLQRWAAAQEDNIEWPDPESFTGKTMKRPIWEQVQAAIDSGKIKRLVVWRLDRLGRTASGLTKLFDDLLAKGVNLVSLKDGIDLSTPAGRLMANVIASVAQYETEIRAERVKAGIAVAKAKGKKWGGSKKGERGPHRNTINRIMRLHAEGRSYTEIGAVVKRDRSSVCRIVHAELKARTA